jgi:nucleoside-diphosphate-sugar epimerase
VLLATKKVPSGSYDVGTGKLTRTGEIARILSKLYKLPSITLRAVEKKGYQADLRALKRATGWQPRITAKEGLAAMVQSKK